MFIVLLMVANALEVLESALFKKYPPFVPIEVEFVS